MAKLSISRLLEASKLLATKSGQELADLITYVNDLADQTLRALRQGLTLADNLKCELITVTLSNNLQQAVNYKGQEIVWVVPMRVISSIYGVENFAWYKDNANQLIVKLGFTNAPTDAQTVNLLVVYQ